MWNRVTFLSETAFSRFILLALYEGIDSHALSHSAALAADDMGKNKHLRGHGVRMYNFGG